MRIRKTDKLGTIHEIAVQLANLAQLDVMNPKTTQEKSFYRKKFEKFNLFQKNISNAKKREIISSLKISNFKEDEILHYQGVLKSVNEFNKIIEEKREQIEEDIRAGINVRKNDQRLRNLEPVEIDIPRSIRSDLRIVHKAVRLKKYDSETVKNKIKYFSGQDYDFLIKDRFNKPYLIPYSKLQKLRRDGNVVKFLLEKFREGIDGAYERDKKRYSKKEAKKWAQKKKVYAKLYKVIEHNIQIATNKKYNKKLVSRDEENKMVKNNSEYPVLMDIFDEMIEIYIP